MCRSVDTVVARLEKYMELDYAFQPSKHDLFKSCAIFDSTGDYRGTLLIVSAHG